jgi:hypothetical protein
LVLVRDGAAAVVDEEGEDAGRGDEVGGRSEKEARAAGAVGVCGSATAASATSTSGSEDEDDEDDDAPAADDMLTSDMRFCALSPGAAPSLLSLPSMLGRWGFEGCEEEEDEALRTVRNCSARCEIGICW